MKKLHGVEVVLFELVKRVGGIMRSLFVEQVLPFKP